MFDAQKCATLRYKEDLEAYKIGGNTSPVYDTISVYMHVSKGGGSAYGGTWKPSKPEDDRLIGKPGEIKISLKKDGIKVVTKIGQDGHAVAERHYTSAPNPKLHSNPHDHEIYWETPRFGMPNFSKPISYWDGVPDFKEYGRYDDMLSTVRYNSFEDNQFKTISDFKECIIRGGEIVFSWKNCHYGVFLGDKGFCIAEADGENEKWCNTADEVLEYKVGSDRLRDVITQVTVLDRTI